MSPEHRAIFTAGLEAHWLRIQAPAIDEILEAHELWRGQSKTKATARTSLLTYLPVFMRQAESRIDQLHRASDSFISRHSRAGSEQERRLHVLSFARALGASERQLHGDEKALRKWFGADAVKERYQRRIAHEERLLAFCVERLAALAAPALRASDDAPRLWRDLDLSRQLLKRMRHAGEERVRLAAYQALDTLLATLAPAQAESVISAAILQNTLRTAVNWHGSVWLQAAALSVLARISVDWVCRAVRRRFAQSNLSDEIFLRGRAVRVMSRLYDESLEIRTLLATAAEDSSAHVRQNVADCLPNLPANAVLSLLPRLASSDPEPAVRAAALLGLPALLHETPLRPMSLSILTFALKDEQDAFVLRVAMQVAARAHNRLMEIDPATAPVWYAVLDAALSGIHATQADTPLQRAAAAAREWLWAQADPRRRDALAQLRATSLAIRSGERVRIDSDVPAEELARLLAVVAQDDCGFEIAPRPGGYELRKHDRFGFRWWRLRHETLNPGSDKRQAFAHTTGRIYSAPWQAQSSIMAEMSQTKVPGEPLYIEAEGGWRPYLPLVDQVISACGLRRQPVHLYSSEGVTVIHPPARLGARLRARAQLSRDVAHLSRLRNWVPHGGHSARAYAEELERLGVRLSFRSHAGQDKAGQGGTAGTFGLHTAVLPPALFSDFADYFVSLYQNSLRELILFLGAVSILFFGRHLWVSQRIRQYRRSLPLVIGGWGTRGKSGTERLKAALFGALGLNLVSKTTGCEAMFVHAPAYGTSSELFLFRPYDKASIWEQVDVMRIARQLGCEVFLWECMALTPAYVATLQRQWMQDDLATICNAYPDHEDLQGPAGINIPQVMQNFVPQQSTLVTSEEQMLPLLRQEASAEGTRCVATGWIEAGLITPDVLERFPYREHPHNIALVLAMARELGIERDFALMSMADQVIPDLGVLKSYPLAPWQNRQLEFVMGMSANERLGCMGNWRRMGFAEHDPATTPGVWTSTVINNRADRTARSKVFASIIVNDIAADRHVLIGTNVDGFMAYMRDAWAEISESLTFWPDDGEGQTPLAVLRAQAETRRIPTSKGAVAARLAAMLDGIGAHELGAEATRWMNAPDELAENLGTAGLGTHAEAVTGQLGRLLEDLAGFEALANAVADAAPSPDLDRRLREQVWQWIERQMLVVEDPHCSSDQLLHMIYELTPPGYTNRIMGLQNIKGTGLGFVYAWQAWENCARACAQLLTACWNDVSVDLRERLARFYPSGLRADDLSRAEQGLRTLASFEDYNQLCLETVSEVCATVQRSTAAQSEIFQAELRLIQLNLDTARRRLARLDEATIATGPWTVILGLIESALDAGDAIRRRRTANQIYKALCDERISTARAALELQALTKRQKGGWFIKAAQTAGARFLQNIRRLWSTDAPAPAPPNR